MSNFFLYRGYGLNIASSFEFPELLPANFESPDVIIEEGETPETLLAEDTLIRVNVSMNANEYLMDFKCVAKYYAANGNSIIVNPYADADAASVRLFLLSSVMAAILNQRNLTPLHASAIIVDGKAVLFMGPSGAGKSTLITGFQKKGYQVFSDDVCVLQQKKNGQMVVAPAYPYIKLWTTSFENFNWDLPNQALALRPFLPKYALPFHDSFCDDVLMVKAIFIVGFNTPLFGKPIIEQLGSKASFEAINNNVYRPLQTIASKRRQEAFLHISALNNQMLVYKLLRDAKMNQLAECMQLIESKLKNMNEG